ncbi:MAG: hypothetical protein HY960_13240 [Ignavibacteriae bacterium]|nr:hypothetical protein [Ignavibacteriota bacterium]
MQEIRLYYECLEQGNDYLLPMISEVVSKETSVKLIKRPKKATQLSNGALSSILSFTTPDALITAVKNDVEYPLALIEFTEAVKTEDHELQRTYGAVAAYFSEMYYIKISGHKKSEKEFGGAEYNPYSTPKILIDTFKYEGYIIADWGTDKNNKFNLQRHTEFPACPPVIQILKDTIQASIKVFEQSEKNWFVNSIKSLKETKSYKIFREEVDAATGTNELLQEWKAREDRNGNMNKLRYFVRKDWVAAKINRFSHAMDPDRGILTFISFVFSHTHKVFGIYALVRPRGNEIMKKDLNSLTTLRSKLKEAIEKDSGGVPSWFTAELIKVAREAKEQNSTINFQPVWEKHQAKISENKVVATIAYFLDGMFLNHNGIKLVWDRRKLLGNSKGEILSLMKKYFSSTTFTTASPTTAETIEVDEDEVTYAIVHRVLIPNKFRIVSISYPGSQGGGAILPDPDLGKAQPREYPDIIALPPTKNAKIDVVLSESKGMFQQSEIEKDTAKILRYKNDRKLQVALKETLVVAQVIDKNDTVRNILIGVAFGVKSNTPTTWKPDEVDFIFRITNRNKWAIGIFNQALKELIPKIEGTTDFPEVYKIVGNPKNRTQEEFEF